MFKKLNTTTLLIIIGLLGGLVLFNKLYQAKKEESTFREEFVKIDSALVTAVYIYPKAEKGKEIKIIKNGSHWDLQNDKVKTAADSNAVRSLLGMFNEIKSVSLAGQDQSSWDELQVGDTSGTKISFVTPSKTYSMVVGKFGYNQAARNGLTYIRHADEDAVYAVEGFLSFTVNQGFHSWRNKTFINVNKDNLTSLTFTYPGDSSFVLNKMNNEWTVNGEKADSANTIQFLNGIANVQGAGFVDAYSPSSTPVYSLTINGNNQTAPVTILAYQADSIKKFILHSSLNPDAYVNEGEGQLMNRIFLGRNHFLAQ